MAYNPTIYVNDSTPAISAENLNKMENGIAHAYDNIDVIATVNQITSVNVFNLNTATRNGYLNSDGEVQSPTDTNYGYSDYIKVSPGDTVRFYRRSQLDSNPGCLYYSNGNIANITTATNYTQAANNGEPSSFTVPSGVTRIRINIKWGYIDEYMVTINNSYPNSYVPFSSVTKINNGVKLPLDDVETEINGLQGEINKIATVDKNQTVNVLNISNATRGGYLDSNGTVKSPTDNDYGYTEFINVTAGDVVRFYRRSQLDTYPGCMYYENGNVANVRTASDYSQAANNGEPSSFTVPSNVTKIRINIRWGYIDEYMITINNAYPSIYVPCVIKTEINDDVIVPLSTVKGKSVLYGKRIMFCGDSITYGAYADSTPSGVKKNFGYYIKESTGCNDLYNAVSGSTMMNVEGKSPFSVDRYQELGDDLDYIVLAFSANDSAEDLDLIGSYSDSTNETFWGAWNIVLAYLIANYPTAKIGIIAFWRGNQKYQYTDALRDIAEKYRIPLLDFMFDKNVPMVGGTDFRAYNPNTPFTVDYDTLVARQDTFLYDTVHPNDAGYQYLATIIQDYLEKL